MAMGGSAARTLQYWPYRYNMATAAAYGPATWRNAARLCDPQPQIH